MIRNLAALALVALISAGCGSDAPSKASTASSTATATTKKLTKQEKAVKSAECMRANSIPDFPDPDPKGETNFGVDVYREVWLKAVDACQGPQATGRAELEADAQGAVGEPAILPSPWANRRLADCSLRVRFELSAPGGLRGLGTRRRPSATPLWSTSSPEVRLTPSGVQVVEIAYFWSARMHSANFTAFSCLVSFLVVAVGGAAGGAGLGGRVRATARADERDQRERGEVSNEWLHP